VPTSHRERHYRVNSIASGTDALAVALLGLFGAFDMTVGS
jgi:hypothetical protein